MTPRAQASAAVISYFVGAFVVLYVVSNRDEFVAFIGTFAVGAVSGAIFATIVLCVRLLRAVTRRS